MITIEFGDNLAFTLLIVGIAFAIAWVRTHRK